MNDKKRGRPPKNIKRIRTIEDPKYIKLIDECFNLPGMYTVNEQVDDFYERQKKPRPLFRLPEEAQEYMNMINALEESSEEQEKKKRKNDAWGILPSMYKALRAHDKKTYEYKKNEIYVSSKERVKRLIEDFVDTHKHSGCILFDDDHQDYKSLCNTITEIKEFCSQNEGKQWILYSVFFGFKSYLEFCRHIKTLFKKILYDIRAACVQKDKIQQEEIDYVNYTIRWMKHVMNQLPVVGRSIVIEFLEEDYEKFHKRTWKVFLYLIMRKVIGEHDRYIRLLL